MGFLSFFPLSCILTLSFLLLPSYRFSPAVWGLRLSKTGDPSPAGNSAISSRTNRQLETRQTVQPSVAIQRSLLRTRDTVFQHGAAGPLSQSGSLVSSSVPDQHAAHFFSALQEDEEDSENYRVLSSDNGGGVRGVAAHVRNVSPGMPATGAATSLPKLPLRERLGRAKAFLSRAKRTMRRWPQRAAEWTRAVIKERLLPFLNRLKFWERGFPPEVPPLTGTAPGKHAVAHFAWFMSAGIQYKPVQERHVSMLEQAVGKYFLPAGVKTWFASESGRRIMLLKRGLIGRGSFGLVFHVEHPLTREVFALKIFARDKNAINFEIDPREIETERQIVDVFEPGWTPERIYSEKHFMVPLETLSVEGKPAVVNVGKRFQILNTCLLFPKAQGDLLSLLHQLDGSEQAFTARMSITIQIIRLLASFHALGLVHGDVKPDNFLVDRSGFLLLSDFTRVFRKGAVEVPQAFTVAFMAPEIANVWTQWTSRLKYEPSTDSWPLGCTIHEVWCNTLPFGIMPSHDANQVVGLIRQARASSLNFHSCNGIPETIQTVVRNFLTKSPAKRLTPQQALDQFSLLRTWQPPPKVTPISDTILKGEPDPAPPGALHGSFDPRLLERRHSI